MSTPNPNPEPRAPATWPTGDLPASKAQIKALVTAGRARGLSVDDLRAMTSTGSLRALTRRRAALLLDNLNRDLNRDGGVPSASKPPPRRRRPSRNVIRLVSPDQRAYLADLWSLWQKPERQKLGWLKRWHGLDSLADVATASQAWKVIEGVKSIVGRQAPIDKCGTMNDESRLPHSSLSAHRSSLTEEPPCPPP